MNPLGARPENLLNHWIKPIQQGKALQFVDQPTRTIKCYTVAQAALGKAVPLYESGEVYYVKRMDLAEALELDGTTATDEELNTALIWHMVQSASDLDRDRHPVEPGAKEFLIGRYYLSQGSAEEGQKWLQLSSQKEYLPAELEIAASRHGVTAEQREVLETLATLVAVSKEDAPERFVSIADDAKLSMDPETEQIPVVEKALQYLFATCSSRAAEGDSSAIDVLFAFIRSNPQSSHLNALQGLIETLIPHMTFYQQLKVLDFLEEACQQDPSLLPKREGLVFSMLEHEEAKDSNRLLDVLNDLIQNGSETARTKMRDFVLQPDHAFAALRHDSNRSTFEKYLTPEECRQFDSYLMQRVRSIHPDSYDLFETYFSPPSSHPELDYLKDKYIELLGIISTVDPKWMKKLFLFAVDGNPAALQVLERLATQGNLNAEVYLIQDEFRQFLTPCTPEKIQSADFDLYCKRLIIANDRAGVPLQDLELLYLLPPELRLKAFQKEPDLVDILFSFCDIPGNFDLRLPLLERVAQFFENESDEELKKAIARSFNPGLLMQHHLEASQRVAKQLIHYPQAMLKLLNQPRLWELLNEEDFAVGVKKALEQAYSGSESECRQMSNFILLDLAREKPRLSLDDFIKITVHGATQHKSEHYAESLFELALGGVPIALKTLQDMSSPLLKAYDLCQWAMKLNVETLKDLNAFGDRFRAASSREIDLLLKSFSGDNRLRRYIPFPGRTSIPFNERGDFNFLLLHHAAQAHESYVPQLLNWAAIAPGALAIEVLKFWANKGYERAKRDLAQSEFTAFANTCTLSTLRSDLFDHAVEKAIAAKIPLVNHFKTLYLLPQPLRMSWVENPPDPDKPILAPFSLDELPEIKEALIQNIDAQFSLQLPPELRLMIANYVLDNTQMLALHEDHPVFQKAIENLVAFETEGIKNPVSLFHQHQTGIKKPNRFVPPAMSVEDEKVRFNLPHIQATLITTSFPRSMLHRDVTWGKWQQLIEQIEKKKDIPAVKEVIDQRTSSGWDNLRILCLNDDAFFKPRIEFSGDPVPMNYAKLNAILHMIFNLSDEGEPLSEKEMRLILFAENIQNCAGGKFDGIELFYDRGLESKDKFPIVIPNEKDPALAKAKSALAEQYQNALIDAFSGQNALMQELTGTTQVSQSAHQSLYLKNLIAHIVGLKHSLVFDQYTRVLSDKLVMNSREEVMKVFFKHFTPQVLVDHVHGWMNRDSETAGRKNWDKVFQLVTPSEEDMDWDEETLLPTIAHKSYARKVLEAAGYLIGD